MATLTRDGRSWDPQYLVAIDADVCIGCGRCFKVCGRGVMTLRGIDEDGALVDLDDDEEVERKVMAFSVDRVEEILRNVIQNELNLIITTGYVLGGLIGVCTFGLQKLLGL